MRDCEGTPCGLMKTNGRRRVDVVGNSDEEGGVVTLFFQPMREAELNVLGNKADMNLSSTYMLVCVISFVVQLIGIT